MQGHNLFTGNIFIHNGNSGGPVICNHKLVGIVSSGSVEQKQIINTNLNYYLHRNVNLVKSLLILLYLKTLIIAQKQHHLIDIAAANYIRFMSFN